MKVKKLIFSSLIATALLAVGLAKTSTTNAKIEVHDCNVDDVEKKDTSFRINIYTVDKNENRLIISTIYRNGLIFKDDLKHNINSLLNRNERLLGGIRGSVDVHLEWSSDKKNFNVYVKEHQEPVAQSKAPVFTSPRNSSKPSLTTAPKAPDPKAPAPHAMVPSSSEIEINDCNVVQPKEISIIIKIYKGDKNTGNCIKTLRSMNGWIFKGDFKDHLKNLLNENEELLGIHGLVDVHLEWSPDDTLNVYVKEHQEPVAQQEPATHQEPVSQGKAPVFTANHRGSGKPGCVLVSKASQDQAPTHVVVPFSTVSTVNAEQNAIINQLVKLFGETFIKTYGKLLDESDINQIIHEFEAILRANSCPEVHQILTEAKIKNNQLLLSKGACQALFNLLKDDQKFKQFMVVKAKPYYCILNCDSLPFYTNDPKQINAARDQGLRVYLVGFPVYEVNDHGKKIFTNDPVTLQVLRQVKKIAPAKMVLLYFSKDKISYRDDSEMPTFTEDELRNVPNLEPVKSIAPTEFRGDGFTATLSSDNGVLKLVFTSNIIGDPNYTPETIAGSIIGQELRELLRRININFNWSNERSEQLMKGFCSNNFQVYGGYPRNLCYIGNNPQAIIRGEDDPTAPTPNQEQTTPTRVIDISTERTQDQTQNYPINVGGVNLTVMIQDHIRVMYNRWMGRDVYFGINSLQDQQKLVAQWNSNQAFRDTLCGQLGYYLDGANDNWCQICNQNLRGRQILFNDQTVAGDQIADGEQQWLKGSVNGIINGLSKGAISHYQAVPAAQNYGNGVARQYALKFVKPAQQ